MILSDFIEMILPHPDLIIVDVSSDYDNFNDTWWQVVKNERYEAALEEICGTGLEAFGLPAEEYDNYKALAYKAILLPKYAYAEVAHLWVTDKAWFIGIYPYECKNGVDDKTDVRTEKVGELEIGDIVTTENDLDVGMVISKGNGGYKVCARADEYDGGETSQYSECNGWERIGKIDAFKEAGESDDEAWRKLTYKTDTATVVRKVRRR